jgi:hypothetical protein
MFDLLFHPDLAGRAVCFVLVAAGITVLEEAPWWFSLRRRHPGISIAESMYLRLHRWDAPPLDRRARKG